MARNNFNQKATNFKDGRSNPKRKPNNGKPKKDDCLHNQQDGRNEFSWYNQNPDLVKASARIPYPYRPGLTRPTIYSPMTVKGTDTAKVEQISDKVPGIMVIRWVPFVGVSKDVTSPISLAARDLFSRVRSAFSGSITVDAPDFVMHVMAMDSVYAYISWLRRIYRTLNTFSFNNTLTPEALLRAMGLSVTQIEDLKEDRTHLFGVINELTSMTQKFFVPDVFPVLKRHVWMSERVYCDAPTPNSQLYVFNPDSLLKFGIDSQGAGKLSSIPLVIEEPSGYKRTADMMMDYGKALIHAISDWDDGYIINGYLQKAFEGSAFFSLEPVNVDERLDLNYNEVVLGQIENAVACPIATREYVNPVGVDITQEPNSNAIISICSRELLTEVYVPDLLKADWTRLSSRMDEPNEENTIENSRLIARWSLSEGGEHPWLIVESAGTEVVTDFSILIYDEKTKDWTNAYVNTAILNADTESELKASVFLGDITFLSRVITTLSNFDWHPIIVAGHRIKSTTGNITNRDFNIGYMGDVHNMTFIDNNSMDYINRCCLYSEFSSFTLNK